MTEFNATVMTTNMTWCEELTMIRVYGTETAYLMVNQDYLDFDVSEGKELRVEIKEP